MVARGGEAGGRREECGMITNERGPSFGVMRCYGISRDGHTTL